MELSCVLSWAHAQGREVVGIGLLTEASVTGDISMCQKPPCDGSMCQNLRVVVEALGPRAACVRCPASAWRSFAAALDHAVAALEAAGLQPRLESVCELAELALRQVGGGSCAARSSLLCRLLDHEVTLREADALLNECIWAFQEGLS